MTNDLATGASFTTFSFTGDGYSLDGNAIELRKLVFASVTTGATLSLPIRLAGTASFSNEGAGVKLSGALDLSVHTLTVSGDGKLDITGPISGSGALTRAGGTGILVLSGDNTYSGVTEISSGVLRVGSSSAFGAASSGTTVDTSGSIQLASSASMTVPEPLVLSSVAFSSLTSLAGGHTWSGSIELQADSTIATNVPLTLSGDISGAGKLRTLGPITLEGHNTYAGGTEVQSHVVEVAGPASLGPGQVKTWLGAALRVANGTYPQSLAISGSTLGSGGLKTLSGSTTWSGPIEMLSPDSALDVQGTLTVSGSIGGASGGGLTLRNTGTLRLSGANTYTGTTSIESGTLVSIGGSAIPDASTVRCDGRLLVEDTEAVGGLTSPTGTGRVTIPMTQTLGIATTGVNGYAGSIDGEGRLHVTGAGTQYLLGTGTHTGGTDVENGTLLVSGTLASVTKVAAQGTFGVYEGGAVGAVDSAGGRVQIGPLGRRFGTATSLELDVGSSLEVVLDATTPGAFSQLEVTGPVVLGGAALNVTLNFVPQTGDSFEILRNQSVAPTSGAFAGRPDGSRFTVGGTTFAITYAGGDGNDIVLSVVAPEAMDAGVDASEDAGMPPETPPSDDAGAPPSSGGEHFDGGFLAEPPGVEPLSLDASSEGGGCGCRTATPPSGETASLALVLLAWMGSWQRRRPRSHTPGSAAHSLGSPRKDVGSTPQRESRRRR
ncbi:MAG: autotransporter-associated beta strand repeat-containing protein [Labilithrix sp.]